MSFVAEQFREEAETLIKDVIFNDNYWTEVTSTLPEKVTKGSDIKVYENSSSSSNVVLKFERTMNGTVKDLQRVLQSKDAQKRRNKYGCQDPILRMQSCRQGCQTGQGEGAAKQQTNSALRTKSPGQRLQLHLPGHNLRRRQ